MTTGTEAYYERRAPEYDRVYLKPERQDELRQLGLTVAGFFAGRRLLEVAAGTGYWTDLGADAASCVVATDVNAAVLDVARSRRSWPPSVDFVVADAFDLSSVRGSFDAAFLGFFWSHVPLAELDRFLAGLVARLEPGAAVMAVDNRYVGGSNHAVIRRDTDGNTYQQRRLADGSTWEVLKNFPTATELEARLARFGAEVEVVESTHYWTATFVTVASPR